MGKNMQTTDFAKLNFVSRGKVRDIYSVGNYLLIVATDRISAIRFPAKESS